MLSEDPYYLQYYQAEYDHFHPLFTPKENTAFVQLKHVQGRGRGIVSAKLALYYSVVNDVRTDRIRAFYSSGTSGQPGNSFK